MNQSVRIALGILIILCLYMLTGLVGCGSREEPASPVANTEERPVMTVQVREVEAVEIPREVLFSGKTAPSRTVRIKAETAGRIIEVADLRGQPLAEGGQIARIELYDREERLEQANAALEQAQLEYEASLRLQKQELRSSADVAQALSRLRGAQQLVRGMELEIENTRLTAPFDGILQERLVEVGDFVGVGDPVADFIDLDPIVVVGQVNEFQIGYMKIGETGHAELAGSGEVDGTIRYVAGEADPQSRTFKVELEVPNPGLAIPAGITAQIRVETERIYAHRISPRLISVSDDGVFGIKIVDADNRVQFIEADIVRFEPDAFWLGGLPREIRLITVGEDFTQPGDLVNVAAETIDWD